jgi:hypothetical protein
MSSLTYTEKAKLEKLLGMSSGYVSNFNDTTFGHFLADIGVDINSQKYCAAGTSKAKKLRQFWALEADFLVGKALTALITHIQESLPSPSFANPDPETEKQIERCKEIAARLLSGKVNLDLSKKPRRYLTPSISPIRSDASSNPLSLTLH